MTQLEDLPPWDTDPIQSTVTLKEKKDNFFFVVEVLNQAVRLYGKEGVLDILDAIKEK